MSRKRIADFGVAFLEGYNDAFDRPATTNPYTKGCGEHDSWRLGHQAAEEEMAGYTDNETPTEGC